MELTTFQIFQHILRINTSLAIIKDKINAENYDELAKLFKDEDFDIVISCDKITNEMNAINELIQKFSGNKNNKEIDWLYAHIAGMTSLLERCEPNSGMAINLQSHIDGAREEIKQLLNEIPNDKKENA